MGNTAEELLKIVPKIDLIKNTILSPKIVKQVESFNENSLINPANLGQFNSSLNDIASNLRVNISPMNLNQITQFQKAEENYYDQIKNRLLHNEKNMLTKNSNDQAYQILNKKDDFRAHGNILSNCNDVSQNTNAIQNNNNNAHNNDQIQQFLNKLSQQSMGLNSVNNTSNTRPNEINNNDALDSNNLLKNLIDRLSNQSANNNLNNQISKDPNNLRIDNL